MLLCSFFRLFAKLSVFNTCRFQSRSSKEIANAQYHVGSKVIADGEDLLTELQAERDTIKDRIAEVDSMLGRAEVNVSAQGAWQAGGA